MASNHYSLKSKKSRFPEKTMINLYKTFIRPNFEYGSTTLITAENKYIYKWEQIQTNVLRSTLILNRNMNNNVLTKCANISSITEIIKQLAKSWYKKSIINNLDKKEYITTAVAFPDTPLAYINN